MHGLLNALPILLAENAAVPAKGDAGPMGGYFQFLPMLAVVVLWWYVLMILPQQKQEKKKREMISALKKNDKVLTSAGIYGTVFSVDEKEDRVVVQISDDRGVKVAFNKASIVRVLDGTKEKATETA